MGRLAVECRLCGCRFAGYGDYRRHMAAFGVKDHLERLRAAHWTGREADKG